MYEDSVVRADHAGLLIQRYYFPLGRPKLLPWTSVRGYEVRPLTFWGGRHRTWGTHRLDWWFHADVGRSRKAEVVVLDVRGVSPAVTPDDVPAFTAELDRHLPGS